MVTNSTVVVYLLHIQTVHIARCRLLERTSDTCNEEWSASVFKFGVLELGQEILSDFLMC